MEWIEAKIVAPPDAVEVVIGYLMAKNITNVRIIDDAEVDRFLLDHPLNWDYKEDMPIKDNAEVIFYVMDEATLFGIEDGLPGIGFGPMTLTKSLVNDDDWLHEWRKTYKPFTIGRGVVVRPFWEEYTAGAGETVFTIDPGAVFGTGLHATTQLCIMALEQLELEEASVLDIGCGSGILFIVALLLGAQKAVACDIDPAAARCAKENARLNNIDPARFEVYTGDISVLGRSALGRSALEGSASERSVSGQSVLEGSASKQPVLMQSALAEGKFDVVIANIVADVIIELAPIIPRFMKKGGIFIASGIIDERAEDVKAAYGFSIKEHKMDGWTCLSIS